MTMHDVGYSVPFNAIALKPFAVPEKESAGPLNFLILEIPNGVAGAGNGYGVVTLPLTPSYLRDEEASKRWPDEALTRDTAPDSITVPWEVLERAEHAALSMLVPPTSAYITQTNNGYALLVVDRFRFGDPEAQANRIEIPIPDGLPGSPEFLTHPQIIASGWEPDGHVMLEAKFVQSIAALGKKAGVDDVTVTIRVGGPTTISGRQNTGPRYFASMVPALLTEPADPHHRGERHRVADFDGEDVHEAEYTDAYRAGADPRTDRAMGSGMRALPEDATYTVRDILGDDDDDDEPDFGEVK